MKLKIMTGKNLFLCKKWKIGIELVTKIKKLLIIFLQIYKLIHCLMRINKLLILLIIK